MKHHHRDVGDAWRMRTAPTHKCRACGALFRAAKPAWKLAQGNPGPCCDDPADSASVRPLSLGQMERIINDHRAAEALARLRAGPGLGVVMRQGEPL